MITDNFMAELIPANTIKVKYFNPKAKLEQHGDWIDLRAAETVTLEPFQTAQIKLGVAIQLPQGYEAYVCPRSSTFKKWHIMQTNSIGIIDEAYCGDNDEWQLPVIALEKTTIHEGDRICQFRIQKKQPKINIQVVDHLGNKDRGGFGASGSN